MDPLTWTLVAYEHVGRPDSVDYHVSPSAVDDLESAAVLPDPPPVSPSHLAGTPGGAEAVAEAQEKTGFSVTPVASPARPESGRSFLESEREDDPARRAGADATAKQAASHGAADLLQEGFRPFAGREVPDEGLEEDGNGSVVQAQPASMRPLVGFDEDGARGPAERWKVIFRTMARPRSTRSGDLPTAPAAAPAELDSTAAEIQPAPPVDDGRPSGGGVRFPTEKKRGERGNRDR